MFGPFFDTFQRVLFLTRDTQENTAEIKEIRAEVRNLSEEVKRLAADVDKMKRGQPL